ncbi:MCE family protein [Nocardia sp. 348MFTsu5.1]|uniref:MCE family protein n=1 Tax=Nocardia sp. 348MFTsu5.1 TaxID=1172185 RepID=UPI000371B5BD|nr:MCE family protein [Nocardia sp. 348MFTsu5.1]
MTRTRIAAAVMAVVLLSTLLAGSVFAYQKMFGPRAISAVFTTATGIYKGDEVQVAGVKVGSVAGIHPQGTSVRLDMKVDRGVKIPADAQAIIVAQNLVADRVVALTPAYRTEGPVMPDGGVIPLERTGVPIEWDEIKTQLTRLATDLGPSGELSESTLGRFIDSTADAMDGNGDKLRATVNELSGVGRILADGSGDIVDIINNLQTFVTTLSSSDEQIVQFEGRLATLTSVLDESRSDLDAALTDLSVAVVEVQRFVASNSTKATEQVQRLVNVTQNLVDHRADIEQLLHVFPTSMANFYNIYNPDTGTEAGVFTLNNFSNPIQFICSGVAAVENLTSEEGAKKCREYLGPVLPLLAFNYLPFPVNPVLGPTADPDNIIYTEPDLVPAKATPEKPAAATNPLDSLLLPIERQPS